MSSVNVLDIRRLRVGLVSQICQRHNKVLGAFNIPGGERERMVAFTNSFNIADLLSGNPSMVIIGRRILLITTNQELADEFLAAGAKLEPMDASMPEVLINLVDEDILMAATLPLSPNEAPLHVTSGECLEVDISKIPAELRDELLKLHPKADFTQLLFVSPSEAKHLVGRFGASIATLIKKR